MNRILLPLMILLGSLLYSWFWNCFRKPDCSIVEPVVVEQIVVPPVVEDTTKQVLAVEDQILFEPLDVYFESGKSSFNRTKEIDNWLSTAKNYLEKNPNEKLSVIGYSDSDGSNETNLSLSVKRAGMVKTILTKEGFSAENLEVSGKGEAEPIVENDTPENKSKNRRVSIRLFK